MKRIVAVGLALSSGLFSGCNRPAGAGPGGIPPRTFEVRGFLQAIDFAGQGVTVHHEEIPGYMPEMTMPLAVKSMDEVAGLRTGTAIRFKLVVTDETSWIEQVKKIDASEVHLAPRSTAGASNRSNVARLKTGDPLPDFHLVDSKRRPITREAFAGKPLLISFIFTRCPLPNFCPLVTNHLKEIRESLPDKSVQFLSVSFDPEFDTPEVLAEYAARQTDDTDQWRFASGTAEEIRRLTQAFSVSVQPEGGTISHGLATALVGPDGIIREIWRGNGWKPSEVLDALRNLSSQPSTGATPPTAVNR